MKLTLTYKKLLFLLILFTANTVYAQVRYEVIDLDSFGAFDINDSGQVVSGQYLWQNGNMTDLGTLEGNYSDANAINDSGQVAGYSGNSSGQPRAFLWQNNSMEDLNR